MSSGEKPCPMSMAKKGYRTLIWLGSYLQSFILLVFRLAWGWELIESGYRHLHHVDMMIKNFKDWGVPFPTPSVYVSGYFEFIAGILLMFGFASRLISIPMIFNFLVAYLTASRENVKLLFKQDISNIINDDAFPFMITAILILAFGPGKFSIDYLLRRFVFHERENPMLRGGEVVNP